jgi:indole-3-glycerol phosphate synthase
MSSSRHPGPELSSRPALERIVSQTRAELEQRKRIVPVEALEAQIAAGGALLADRTPGSFVKALAAAGVGVIAEFKRRSPSAGLLLENADVQTIVTAYERGGASALSVLTEGPNFGGSLADLRTARAASWLPILRKDFVVDPYQLYEARAAGADAVLLIVAALGRADLAALREQATALDLDVLVEVHDSDELARAAALGARLIGVNNRDLRDFTVDVRRTFQLLSEMPAGTIVVSESGIGAAEQLYELERQGVAAVLVGETLMRAPDPQARLAALLGGLPADVNRGYEQGSKPFIKSSDAL